MIDLPFVLLAAGRSARMGQSKALLEYRGQPWLLAQIQALRAQTQGPIRVVLGPHCGREANLLAAQEGLHVLLNPDPERGSFSSLQVGLEDLPGPVFMGPLDCPVASVLEALWAGLASGVEAVVPTHQGKGGHPVLLGPTLVARLQALDPESPEARLDRQLRQAPVRRVDTEDVRVLLNLNTPAAWAAYVSGGS